MNEEGRMERYDELNESGQVIGSLWYEISDGKVNREYLFKNGVVEQIVREIKGNEMTEYDNIGNRSYKGGYVRNGYAFVRNGEGTEYDRDGESIVYTGMFGNGQRHGEGTIYVDGHPVYFGEWKNGLRDDEGLENGGNMRVVRERMWVGGNHGVLLFEDGYGNDLSVFDSDSLQGIRRVEIGNDCLKNVLDL
ncbi:hypothetical protein JH06_3243 [Blastocystis sp. subtype 4]|uniref:hypothetical protein n=1 Tax=Blastocystis sp. subtype 4 TaxID=944170 RepID=UPI00071186FC|nr:hypothetical protein JH06_3243 [Blastocystis sp. subtype 4]KNB44014.1 hypothetical protein JH06_3243 [Blastocystis sp. subtype 4]|eukprot:XP_014527457.1 hypothetical protein JH06_3243 [Blastocystis sp. subtype 4]